ELETVGSYLSVVASTSTSADVSANKPVDERPRTSLWCILAYSAPSMPVQAFFTMFTVYLIPYLTSELGFTVSQVSLVLLVGPLPGLTAAPVMGGLSDRSGRRLGLFTTGCVAMAACQIVLAWSRDIVGGDPAAARWLSAAAVYMGCISARASIVGHRAMAIDNIPPRQQPVFNLASGLMSASGAIATLAVSLVRPSFRAITAICVVSITLSIFHLWAVRKPLRMVPHPLLRRVINISKPPSLALAFAVLGVSTLAAVVFQASFAVASIYAVSIIAISPLSVWVPFTIISYEVALVHGEKDGDLSTPWGSSATYFSLHEMAITVGQGLAVLMSGVISFGLEHKVTGARNTTAFLFPPAVVAAMVAALLC
ncbi:hypothetical protein CTA2_6111, partial [Colletotrichum tanaceti]